MSLPPVFPALAGQGWSVHKKPTFSTLVANHVSGREARAPLYQNPIWAFELTFDGLDGTAINQYGGLAAQSLQSLMGLFLTCQGQYGAFVYYDPTDCAATGQTFGTGDGTTTSFSLRRSLGGFSEPVVAPVTSAATLAFPGGATVAASPPVIQAAGVTVSASNYAITAPGGVVTFSTAPAAGAALTWSGYFGFLCRFDGDGLDFEQFMANLWRAESVKFRSLRGQ